MKVGVCGMDGVLSGVGGCRLFDEVCTCIVVVD